MDKILVTGCAGFIGMHLCKSLLDDQYQVLGVDNLNDYYNPNLKNDRLDILKKYDNFHFKKVNLKDEAMLETIFKKTLS